MTDEQKRIAEIDARMRADAEAGDKLDKLLAGLDGIGNRLNAMDKRMDAIEAGKKPDTSEDGREPGDPEQVAADRQATETNERTDHAIRCDAQEKADAVAQAFGEQAPRPLTGETAAGYRRRFATKMKIHSPAWRGVDLHALTDSAVFDTAETQIYADAVTAARNPEAPDGELITRSKRLPSGHIENSFYGRPSAWMNRFGGNRQFVTKIATPNGPMN